MDGKIPEIDRKKAFTAVVAVAAIFLGLSPFLLDETTVETRTLTFEANGTALNTSGNQTIDLGVATGEGLSFGRIPVEGQSTKYFNIAAGKKALLYLDAEGNISEQLDYEPQHFFQGEKEVDLVFDPENVGFYEGNVSININVPENEVGATWLALKAELY